MHIKDLITKALYSIEINNKADLTVGQLKEIVNSFCEQSIPWKCDTCNGVGKCHNTSIESRFDRIVLCPTCKSTGYIDIKISDLVLKKE